jgi:hypothetical protein
VNTGTQPEEANFSLDSFDHMSERSNIRLAFDGRDIAIIATG